jgi:hypothetical protein
LVLPLVNRDVSSDRATPCDRDALTKDRGSGKIIQGYFILDVGTQIEGTINSVRPLSHPAEGTTNCQYCRPSSDGLV